MCHRQKSGSLLLKCVTVRKVCHSQKNVSRLKNVSQKNVSQLEKLVTVRKVCHSLKVSQLTLKRWLTVRKMRHSYNNVYVKVMKPNFPLNNDFKLFLYVELNLTRKIAQTKYILSIKICNHIRERISVSNNLVF